MALGITRFSTTTLILKTFSIMAFGITTFSMITLILMTLNLRNPRIKTFCTTLKICSMYIMNVMQSVATIQSVIILSVAMRSSSVLYAVTVDFIMLSAIMKCDVIQGVIIPRVILPSVAAPLSKIACSTVLN